MEQDPSPRILGPRDLAFSQVQGELVRISSQGNDAINFF